MFKDASELTAAHEAEVYSHLEYAIDGLEATATSWFDETSQSVRDRRAALHRAANLCYRIESSVNDPEDAAEVMVLRENLIHQAKELEYVEREISNSEYDAKVGTITSTIQFTSALEDESRIASRRETDWDLFLAIEPREFVIANVDAVNDDTAIRRRAFEFIEDAVSGHGMNRQAKQNIASAFLARVESEAAIERESNVDFDTEEIAPTSFEDGSLFF